jgi:hypothetical protein
LSFWGKREKKRQSSGSKARKKKRKTNYIKDKKKRRKRNMFYSIDLLSPKGALGNVWVRIVWRVWRAF